jgi:hypothetical protein
VAPRRPGRGRQEPPRARALPRRRPALARRLPRAVEPFRAWDAWQPETPTLLVVDYVRQRVADVRGLLLTLARRREHAPLDRPVRVLLVERQRDAGWWEPLLAGSEGDAIRQSAYSLDPLAAGDLGPEHRWSIVETITRDAGRPAPEREATLADLDRIDPAGRPLFAAMAGEALAAGADIRGWGKTDLLDRVLKDERRRWPAEADARYRNLLAFATMTGGLTEAVLAAPPDGIALPPPDGLVPEVYAAISGQPAATTRDGLAILPALQPDILGEFFALEHLRHDDAARPLAPGACRLRADRFRAASWALGGIDAHFFAVFLDRAKDDFLGHQSLTSLLAPPADGNAERALWGALVVNVVSALGRAGRLDEAAALLARLGDLAAEHPGEPEIRFEVAKGADNLANILIRAGRLHEAAEIYLL